MNFREYLNEAAQNLGKYALRINEDFVYHYNNDSELKESLENYDMENTEDKILFAFEAKDIGTLTIIKAIYAQKGFGPIAYEIALSMYKELSPTQEKTKITKSASNVWKEFHNGKGTNKVTKKLINADLDDNWQNYKYTLKKKVNYSKNIQIHNRFLGNDPYNEKITMLDELADGILRNKMNEIY